MVRNFVTAAALIAALLGACSPSENEIYLASKSDVVLQTEILRDQGICLNKNSDAVYKINNIHDFWLVEARTATMNGNVSIAISRYPDLKTDIKYDTREYRAPLKRPKILRVAEGGILVVPNNLTSQYIHIYSGTPADREAALKLVTFCKPQPGANGLPRPFMDSPARL